jgi:hypothetical protein
MTIANGDDYNYYCSILIIITIEFDASEFKLINMMKIISFW